LILNPINVLYKGKDLSLGYRTDMLIEDMLVLELKSVDLLTDIHKKQLHTNLDKNIIRIINGDISSL